MLRVATAFSGGFGSVEFALKYENIDHEVVFAIEWMDAQRKSYLLNHGEPTGEFAKDICDFDGTKYRGQIDYYHLSPPCQSYSMAGKREGADSDKGQLMFEAIKSLSEVQPKMFTIENVAGLLSSNGGEDFNNIMRDLRKHLPNYTIHHGKLNAKDMGTPQNRLRVFIVGFRADVQMMPFPAPVPLERTLQDVLDDDVDSKYYLSQKMLSYLTTAKRAKEFGTNKDNIMPTLQASYHKQPTDGYYMLSQIASIDKTGQNRQAERIYDTQVATTQSAVGGGGGAKTGLYAVQPTGAGVVKIDGVEYSVRRLTPRECARCFGDSEDRFKMGDASDTKLYEFIGNAIDINTMRRLIAAMTKHIEGRILNPVKVVEHEKIKVQCSLFGDEG